MFSSKRAITSTGEVPSAWVFEHYLALNEKLEGQNIKIKSVFNPMDTIPSMSIFISNNYGKYNFYCHSTGLQGGMVELVELLFSLDHKSASYKIIDDYRKYLNENSHVETRNRTQYKENWKVLSFKTKGWGSADVDFWSPYNIGSKLLEMYNIKPLSSYVIGRNDEQIYISAVSNTYAYLSKSGEVHKIYQPKNPEKKFMTFTKYIQGWDQIQGKSRLFICSSLKDIMSMRSLGIDGDYIAPNSETSGLHSIIEWINTYPEKYIIFDNDEAGLKTMQTYERVYKIPYVHLDLSKDISDSVKDHGAKCVKAKLNSLIK